MRGRAFFAPALALVSLAAQADDLQNWFNDPFFSLTSAMPECPEPAGPRVTLAERQIQAHRRAEKGTTCWLAKEAGCDRPNAYAYDRDIATEILSSIQARHPFPNTSLWVTVQGRVVYIEGCVPDESEAAEIEAFVRELPHVQRAIAIVKASNSADLPYRLFAPR